MTHRVRQTVSLAVAVPVVATALSACGGGAKPVVCSDLDELKASLQSSSVPVGEGRLEALRSDIDNIRSAATQIKTDAKGEFGPQIDALTNALSTASTAVTTAAADPTRSAIATAVASAKSVVDAGRGLATAVEDTC